VKVVTCVKGAIFDVIIDLRPQSAQFCKWQAIELSEKNRRRLYVPKGFAHGFQTLCDECEIHYMISEFYSPGSSSGVRYDDPAFAIGWPLPVNIISEKDCSWPNFTQQRQP
jgi:dTDP-4-dehydrorhamnose 3,5-epimerase